MTVFIFGTIFVFAGLIIYVVCTFIFLVSASSIGVMKSTSATGESKCIDDFHAMFSGAGVGCLVGSIGAIGSFIASICTTCGICKARDHVADEEVMRSRAVAQLHYTMTRITKLPLTTRVTPCCPITRCRLARTRVRRRRSVRTRLLL